MASTISYERPTKKIKDREAFDSFKKSSRSLNAIRSYVQECDLAYEFECEESSTTDEARSPTTQTESDEKDGGEPSKSLSERIKTVNDLIELASQWIDEIPLQKRTDMRFGNKTFAVWHQKFVEHVPIYVKEHILPEDRFSNAYEELSDYLSVSFGDPTRIDFGTGHECSFMCVLYCLEAYGYFLKAERNIYVLQIFKTYMMLMRKLQSTYVLEPAGSHGVWGLDDFHHVVFILGASQMKKQQTITPNQVLTIAQSSSNHQNLFIAAVRNILDTKKGAPFFETSPSLNDILSTVPSWEKLHLGLIKMWEGEVLEKFPVIQHFLFGTTLPYS